jgi:hypothetical protein
MVLASPYASASDKESVQVVGKAVELKKNAFVTAYQRVVT